MCSFRSCQTRFEFLSQFRKVRNAFECFVTQVQTRLPKTKCVWPMKINVICTVRIGNSVCRPMNDTTQWEHPDIPIGVPFAPRNVREVDLNVPTGALSRTSVWYKELEMAVTEDPESTKNSTEWSPIHPSRNQCPDPEICRVQSSTCSLSIGSDRPVGELVCASAIVSEASREVVSDIGRSGTAESTRAGDVNSLVDPIPFWSENRTAFLVSVSGSEIVSIISEFWVELWSVWSGGEDEIEPWWSAVRPVWVSSRFKQSFPVVERCPDVVDCQIACFNRLVYTEGSSLASGNRPECVQTAHSWNTWSWNNHEQVGMADGILD